MTNCKCGKKASFTVSSLGKKTGLCKTCLKLAVKKLNADIMQVVDRGDRRPGA